jgi:aspartate racemase
MTGTRLGLIGGLAPRAGIYYYEQILARHVQLERPAEIMLIHADVGRVLAAVADIASLGAYLGGLSNALFDGGSSTVAITAVAPHLAIDAIMGVSRGPIINMLDDIAAGLSDAGLRRVAVFGNTQSYAQTSSAPCHRK